MTKPDAMQLLREKCAELGQAKVARLLGISAPAISQIISGKYGASPDAILTRVVEVFGGLSVDCPVLGDIPLARCADERRNEFPATNHQDVELRRACPDCRYNGGNQS